MDSHKDKSKKISLDNVERKRSKEESKASTSFSEDKLEEGKTGDKVTNNKNLQQNGANKQKDEDRWKSCYVPYSAELSLTPQKSTSADLTSDKDPILPLPELTFTDKGTMRWEWRNKMEGVCACVGTGVAACHLWRFPMLIIRYGGAFLFAYVVVAAFIGLPLYLMEMYLGQFVQLGVLQSWGCSPLMQGVGVASILLSMLCSIYNSQVLAYSVYYFISGIVNVKNPLWSQCSPEYPSECHPSAYCLQQSNTSVQCAETLMSSTYFCWQKSVLQLEPLSSPAGFGVGHGGAEAGEGGLVWQLCLCLLLGWLIAATCSSRSVKSLGRVMPFTAFVPIGVMVALLVGACMAPGAVQGLDYLYSPMWEVLGQFALWQDAAAHLLFSMALTYGVVQTFASYNSFHNKKVQIDVISLCIANVLLSVLAATTLFALIGNAAYAYDARISDIAAEGIDILFVTYPEVISSSLSNPAVWCIFFFLAVLLMTLHAQCSLLEVSLTTVYDLIPSTRRRKHIFVFLLCAPLYLLSLPMCMPGGLHIFNMIGSCIIGPNVLLLGVLMLVALHLMFGVRRFSNALQAMLGVKPSIVWKVCWVFVAPVFLLVLVIASLVNYEDLLRKDRGTTQHWALIVTWTLSLLPLVAIPIVFLFAFFKKLCTKEGMLEPCKSWGSGNSEERRTMYGSRGLDNPVPVTE